MVNIISELEEMKNIDQNVYNEHIKKEEDELNQIKELLTHKTDLNSSKHDSMTSKLIDY